MIDPTGRLDVADHDPAQIDPPPAGRTLRWAVVTVATAILLATALLLYAALRDEADTRPAPKRQPAPTTALVTVPFVSDVPAASPTPTVATPAAAEATASVAPVEETSPADESPSAAPTPKSPRPAPTKAAAPAPVKTTAKATVPTPRRDTPPASRPQSGGSPPAGGARAYARSRVSAAQFGCLDSLWERESGWRVTAANASGAYGIPQALPGNKMASAGADWRTNPATQIDWGLSYIAGRYGSPCAAWSFWKNHNWY